MMLQVLAAAAIGAAAMVPNLLPPDPVPEPPATSTAPAPGPDAELIRVTVQATDAQGLPVAFDGDLTISAGDTAGSVPVHLVSGRTVHISVPLTSGRIAWLNRLAIG